MKLHKIAAALALSAAALSLGTMTAQAAMITFAGPIGTPVAATVEGNFAYSTFSGGLFRDTQGNGDGFNMEGCSACGGGVLRVVRNDVANGLFTFGGSDVAFQFTQAFGIAFEGFLAGASLGVDTFVTTANSGYSTHASSVLAGMQLDELRVTLAANNSTATVVDNLVVNAAQVPEPGTLALLCVAGLAAGAARRRAKQTA